MWVINPDGNNVPDCLGGRINTNLRCSNHNRMGEGLQQCNYKTFLKFPFSWSTWANNNQSGWKIKSTSPRSDKAFAKWLLKILSSILTGLLAHVSPTGSLTTFSNHYVAGCLTQCGIDNAISGGQLNSGQQFS